MEVQVISKETIKPSSPTPHHRKIYKLSMLDQYVPSFYVPVILFYSINQESVDMDRSVLLKQSLSETLAKFYPFAGEFRDSLSIDCNDEGMPYVEARVSCSLSEFLSQSNLLASLDELFPREAFWGQPIAGSPVALVQENTFTCGGMAIGLLVSHSIADGNALSSFLEAWSAIASKCDDRFVSPNFDASDKFPQRDSYPIEATFGAVWTPFIRKGRAAPRRFVFDSSSIARLQAKISNQKLENPTRVEAVSALLWKCSMAAFKSKSNPNTPTALSHTLNLRRRAMPPFPKGSVGNFILPAPFVSNGEETMTELICSLREEIPKLDANFVRNLQGDGGLAEVCRVFKELDGKLGSVAASGGQFLPITSWCNFGIYGVDFGFGKPVWASVIGCSGSAPFFTPIIYLLDTIKPKGIEASVILGEDELVLMENDEELLAYASVDPSPLELSLSA